MKNIISKILLGTCLIAGISCSDQFLQDKKDYNNMVPLDVYSDPVQANAVYATIHKQILERYNWPFSGADPLLRQGQANGGNQYILSEEIATSDFTGAKYNGSNDKTTKAGNHIANPPYWNQPRNNANYNNFNQYTLFPTVFLVNNFIGAIDQSRSLYNNETFWNNLKGQAIFARAWLYFDGVRFYGGVPYYNTEKDMAQPGDRSDRLSIQECMDKICADFEEAASLLPAKWDVENEGRFTSVAAYAMISRVRLYMASPVFNANWDSPDSKRWKQALDASVKAYEEANKAGYGTSVTDIDSWDKAFYNYAGTTFNPEAIFKVMKSDNTVGGYGYNKWESSIRPGIVANTTGSGMPAPDQMITLFPMKDGKRATVGNGYNDDKFYRNRDPRFYRTFAFSGCQWPGTTTQLWLYAYQYKNDANYVNRQLRYTDGSSGDGGASKKSRAIVWKMSDPKVAVGSESTQGTDILEYRYAEILLNVAECYAATGNIAKASEFLGKIRGRVGIPSTDNYGIGTLADKYAAIEACLYERAVELAYEGKRTWDLRRWLLYEGGAGFDPRMNTGIDSNNKYNPELAWGSGWKIYDGKEGRPEYSKMNNVLTKLRIPRFCGTKHEGKVWTYKLDEQVFAVEPANHPLKTNALLSAVTPITREMSETARNTAFDKLDAFYTGVGMQTVNPGSNALATTFGPKYAMDMGTSASNLAFLFSWRGWYYVYPIHYDAYDPAKGNSWISQCAGWMVANAAPSAAANMEEQNGTYYYCHSEK